MTEEAAGGIVEQEREAALALGRLAQELAAQDQGRDEQQAQLQRDRASVERLRAVLDDLAAQQTTAQVRLGVGESALRLQICCWLCAAGGACLPQRPAHP